MSESFESQFFRVEWMTNPAGVMPLNHLPSRCEFAVHTGCDVIIALNHERGLRVAFLPIVVIEAAL